MGWDFVVIDTSNLLKDGLTNVASMIRYVFDRLGSLTDCVILFDEIKEFCLDRETLELGMESRLLTISMLTQINDTLGVKSDFDYQLLRMEVNDKWMDEKRKHVFDKTHGAMDDLQYGMCLN